MPSVTPLSFKASFTAKGMTLAIPPGWFKPTGGKTSALSSLKNNFSLEGIADLRNHGTTELRSHGTIIFSWYPLFVSKWVDYASI